MVTGLAQIQNIKKSLLGFLLISLIVLTMLALFEKSRLWLKHSVFTETRTLLSKVEGDLTGQGDLITVFKVKTRQDLILEIFSQNTQKTESQLRARIILPERRDGFFNFRGSLVNLALVDINSDGILEIITSTYDENLIPRLHVYRYDPQAQVFQLAGPDLFPLEEKTKEDPAATKPPL